MPSRSFRNNNPGNLRFSPFTKKRGAVEADGYSRFPTPIQGTACILDLLAARSYRNLTLAGAINRYAPSDDNNIPREYADYVASRSGIAPDRVLSTLSPFEALRLLEAMIRFEGWTP